MKFRSPIRPESATPISTQVRTLLLHEIESGRLAPGARIPSERELAERLRVSRTSVREGIARLISDNVLQRSQRRGTFVADDVPPPATATRTVAYLVSQALLEFFHTRNSRILAGAQAHLAHRGFQLVFHATGDDPPGASLKGLQHGGRLTFDGCILAGRCRRETTAALLASAAPVVLVDRDIGDLRGNLLSVRADYAAGTCLAMDHLRRLGHERIGFVGFADSQKYSAYCDALRELRIAHAPELVSFLEVFDLPPAILAGYQATQRLLERGSRPTALLVTNDLVALGAMEALSIAGIRVPADISLVGFDDLGQITNPPLTRVRADLDQMGRTAAAWLIRLIAKEPAPQPRILLPVDFMVGGSTGVPAISF
jgi:DNA-binding LacI/PurR family transcriptional regulator